MKTRASFFFGRLLLPATALVSFSGSAHALTKLSNATSLNAAGSWVENAVPLSSDVLTFDSAINTNLSVAVGASSTVGGSLLFTGNTGTVAITQSSGQTWTLGSGGIDMSSAAANVTLGTSGATIRWASANYGNMTVASGRTLTFNSNWSNQGNTKTIIMGGGGSIIFNGSAGAGGATGFSVQGGTSLTLNGTGGWGGSSAKEVINGTLNIGSDTALGSAALALGGTSSTTPTITASGGARTISNNINLLAVSVAGNATITGTNALTVNGVLTNSGANRTLSVNNTALTTFGTGGIALSEGSANRVLTINGSGNVTVSGVVANGSTSTASGLTYSGTGLLSLSNANTFGGTLTATSGTTRIDNTLAAQNATVSVGAANSVTFGTGITNATFAGLSGAGDLALTNTDTTAVTLKVGNNNVSSTYTGALSGTGSLDKIGAGTLNVSNTSNAVAFTVTGGTLNASATGAGNGGFGSGAITFKGGTIDSSTGVNNTLSFANAVTVGSGDTGTFNTPNRINWSGNVSGEGILNIDVTTTVSRFDLQNSWTGFTGNANFTGSGGVRLFNNGGTFNTNSFQSTALDLGGSVNFQPQTNSGGNIYQIGSLSGSSATASLGGGTAGRATYSVGALDTSTSFAGAITGNSALTKEGTGTLTLSGTNSFTGATLISGGTLLLDATGTIDDTSGVSLGTSGTFDVSVKGSSYAVAELTGSGDVLGALTISTELAIGNSPGTVDFSDDLTLGASSTYVYELIGDTYGVNSADLGNVTGDLLITSGAALDLVQLGTYTVGDKFTLFSYTGTVSGTFSGLIDGAEFTDADGLWEINYFDDVAGTNGGTGTGFVTITAITPVPEPRAALLGGLGLIVLLRRRRGQ